MKGGSSASDYVHSLLPSRCLQKQNIKKYPVLRSNLKGINMYQTAGGRKKKVSKKGGSYLSEHMNKVNSISRKLKSKKNPGIFPNVRNRQIYLLNKTPKVYNGGGRKSKRKSKCKSKRKSNQNKKGGKYYRSHLMEKARSKKNITYSHFFKPLFGDSKYKKFKPTKMGQNLKFKMNTFSGDIKQRPMFNNLIKHNEILNKSDNIKS
jgi:hypothetical protein